MSETVWIVGTYCDTLKERDAKKVAREQETAKKYGFTAFNPSFPTKHEAMNFMVARAQKRVTNAEANLRKERLRLRKVEKLGAAGGNRQEPQK